MRKDLQGWEHKQGTLFPMMFCLKSPTAYEVLVMFLRSLHVLGGGGSRAFYSKWKF